MTKLSAVLKVSLYCSFTLCFCLSQSANLARAEELKNNQAPTESQSGTPQSKSTVRVTKPVASNSQLVASQRKLAQKNNNASAKESQDSASAITNASKLNLGPKKDLPLPKIKTPPNFAHPPSGSATWDTTQYSNEDDIVINADDTTATYKAKLQEVAVNGNSCKITITGRCSSIVINGSNNTIKLEAVGEIVANGDRNQIKWLQGLTNGKAPVIANNGDGNDIAKVSLSKPAKTP